MTTKLVSPSTPTKKVAVFSYCTELFFIKHYHKIMPPNFWRIKSYRKEFSEIVKVIRSMIKKYGEESVLIFFKTTKDFGHVLTYGMLHNEIKKYVDGIEFTVIPKIDIIDLKILPIDKRSVSVKSVKKKYILSYIKENEL